MNDESLLLNHLDTLIQERIARLERINDHYLRILNHLRHCKDAKIAAQEHAARRAEEGSDAQGKTVSGAIKSGHDQSDNGKSSILSNVAKRSNDGPQKQLEGGKKEENVITPESLDDILAKARQIREAKSKKKTGSVAKNTSKDEVAMKKASVPPAPASTPAQLPPSPPSETSTSSKTQLQQQIQNKNEINPESEKNNMKSKGIQHYEDLVAQLDFLARKGPNRQTAALTAMGHDKDLYCSQAKLLSAISGRPCFPKSLTYTLIQRDLRHLQLYHPSIFPLDVDATNTSNTTSSSRESYKKSIDALTKAVKKAREFYERRLKSKCVVKDTKATAVGGGRDPATASASSTIPFSNLHKDDHLEIIRAWYRAQRYIELYEVAIKANDNESPSSLVNEDEKIWQQVHDLITLAPLHTPLRLIRTSPQVCRSKEWLKNAMGTIESFHRALQSRVQFVIESSIGKHQVREIIRSLKQCCEIEVEARGAPNNVELQELSRTLWINTLKSFRAIHSCLVNEAQAETMHFLPAKEAL